MTKILVLGATGLVGRSLVKALAAQGAAVKAASRSGKPVDGAEGVAFDFADPATYAAAFEGVDRVFMLAPTGTEDLVATMKPVIAAAAARELKIVLMTAMGVDASDAIPYRQVELFLIGSGAPHVILRPTWFADNFATYWLHGVRAGVIAVPAADGKTAFIDTRDIAAVAAAVLTTSTYDGKALDLTGPRPLGYAEAAALVSVAVGKPVVYQPSTDEAFIATLVAAGLSPTYSGFVASLFHPVREGWTAAVTDRVQTITGRPPRTVEAWVQENAALLKG